jgi:folate-binding protein YgfZ
MESPLLKDERALGAATADFSGAVLPASFSGFESEYRAAREAVGLFDANWSAVLSFAGPDRARYLNAILTNNILSLNEGRGIPALLLNVHGHILFDIEVYALGDRLLGLVHNSARERAMAALDKYIVMDDVRLEDLSDQTGSVGIEGPRAAGIVEQACGVSLAEMPEYSIRDAAVSGIACHVLRRSHFGEVGAIFITRRDRLASLWGKLLLSVRTHGGEPIGMTVLNSLRLEAGIPWFPVDFNDTVIPHEAAIEKTHVSFTKGCYTGQEIVERVRSRGHVNRRRVQLKFSTNEPPAAGTKLRSAVEEAGVITSAALSPREGTAIGMGYVRRGYVSPGTSLEFDGGTATVRE